MTTKELIEKLNLHDPRGECVVSIEVLDLVGGIGNGYARLPTIDALWRGIDWSSGQVILRPSIRLRANKQSRKQAQQGGE